jgi:uncharacterized Zn-finger protein
VIAYLGSDGRIAKLSAAGECSMARSKVPNTPTETQSPPVGPAPETVIVHSHRIACDGVGGALGHPRVYLEMGGSGFVECPYCDRRFVLAQGDEGPEDERLAPGVYEGAHGH